MSESSSSSNYVPSESSVDTYEIPTEVSSRGRGLSRQRGSRARRGGRAGGRARGGRAGRSGSARGRSGSARGKRVQHGLQVEVGEVERLMQLRQERKRKAHNMIDKLDDGGAKRILKRSVDLDPSLILEVAAELAHQDPEPEPEPGPSDPEWPEWCVCRHCIDMDRDLDKVCCGMRPNLCHSIQPEMELYVTDPVGISINQMMRDDIFAQQAVHVDDLRKSRRHAAYRLYILWQHGRLPRHERHEVPACCVAVIRRKYPDPSGLYVGFRPGVFG